MSFFKINSSRFTSLKLFNINTVPLHFNVVVFDVKVTYGHKLTCKDVLHEEIQIGSNHTPSSEQVRLPKGVPSTSHK